MDLRDFDYDLPRELIAQEPTSQRDQSRLMVVDRRKATISHHVFRDLPDQLAACDLLVLNDTRVLPARLLGQRERTGGHWEGLFLRELPSGDWEMLCQTGGKPVSGESIVVEPGPLRLTLTGRTPEGHWLVRPMMSGSVVAVLERYGHVPLPPYVRKGRGHEQDRERYQTVFARQPGAVAAPTAGLHFSPRVFDGLQRRGIGWTFLTLHVGLGTFQPMQAATIAAHRMHREWAELPAAAASAINECRDRGGRVIAVGTTCVRTLETVAALGDVRPWRGETDLFIYPPYDFRAVDALLTNFHLPRTTLLLLVSAFGGIDLIRKAYQTAIAEKYRFYSYGDAMLIV